MELHVVTGDHMLTPCPDLPQPVILTYAHHLPDMAHECMICGKSYSIASCLYRHMRQRHKEEPALRPHKGPQLPCPVCRHEHKSRLQLHKHLSSEHGIEVKSEQLIFHTMNEFNKWKEQMELETKTTFSRSNLLKRPDKTMIYYYCGRSGRLKSCSTGLRKLKRWGSRKMGAACPAQITVYDSHDQKIDVHFVSTHVGHDFEEVHCHGYLKKYPASYPPQPKQKRRGRIPQAGQLQDGESGKGQGTGALGNSDSVILTEQTIDTGTSAGWDTGQPAVYRLVHDQVTNEPVYILQVRDVDAGIREASDHRTMDCNRLEQEEQAAGNTSSRSVTPVVEMQCNMCPAKVPDLRDHYHVFHKISPSKVDRFLSII